MVFRYETQFPSPVRVMLAGIVALCVLLSAPVAVAQTGPGGVGTNDGTSNLELWLDASDLSLSDGDDVSSWTDVSGNGNDATAGNAPTFVSGGNTSNLNGRAAVSFDGSDDYLSLSSNITSVDGTYFIVTIKPGGEDTGNAYKTLMNTEKHVIVGEANNEDGTRNLPPGHDGDNNEWGGVLQPGNEDARVWAENRRQ